MASAAEIESLISVALELQAQKMQAQLASRDEVISKLMEKVELQEVETSTNLPPHNVKGKLVAKRAKPNHTPVNQPKASASSKPQTPIKSSQPSPRRTPCGSQKNRVSTPKTSLPKAHPCQMVSRDMPECFARTRDALYVHIKLIWNLLKQKTIPGPPHPDTLREFTACFLNAKEIKQIADDATGAGLIPVKEVVTLKGLQLGRKKVGKGLVNLEEFFASGAQIVPPGGRWRCLLAHEHQNKTGKFQLDEERKVIAKARERLRDSQLRFALNQNLPKRYQKIISDINCHSDDKYSTKRGVYIVKTLKFRSENATKFFRRLDAVILTSDELDESSPNNFLINSLKLMISPTRLKTTVTDTDETDNNNDASFNGEDIDLANTSNDEDKEDDADEDDQAFVDDSDASNHGHKDTTKEDEEENDREARYNAMVLDEEL
ncbi:hypothetical protein PCASD_13479 [Puccinia coronata f. sp. avenae]|uniref:Uncharacterized protein n=1 Tax=Puccinia coronata f. sp. avenae TaxID=200324 RepID=A0A2N5TEI5_9BASI|nr:hypothetical protein PCASD_13479 [Puccinia coronata f. sp. avenae]